ncbi:uncharacterized protein Dwil_GK15944, isoform C [Drosophila willistoni]|uniref:Uncharacterized protein, isoform C n=1 Tax=Drosophila willistoni TaxID=7260 RepID=A0A0Q9WQD8_DROWI|nr:ERI1 exoribonuclease 2 isoform X1 [Drosophila willistoni]KRF98169.1 uncharacterized protein Dwil_GK15944, isoform C [Drosophila willistoni]
METCKLLIKSMPCEMEELAQLIQELNLIIPRSLNNFGRRRAILEYVNPGEAQLAYNELKGLDNLLDKPLRLSPFGNKSSNTESSKNKANKSSQTTKSKQDKKKQLPADCSPEEQVELNKQLGLIDTIYVDGGARPDRANENDPDEEANITVETVGIGVAPAKVKKVRKSKQLAMQPYSYVIAVDFEATCWEKQAPPQWREAEIIEFPAVLVNLKTGKVEAEFHKYIMPIESPRLSSYCTELTGIQQKTVDNGIPLQTALMMFHEWLRKELRARNLVLPKMSKSNILGNCAFVTWTDWDFGICLAKECSRKRMRKAVYFNQWIDVRAIYREWYKYRPCNFSDALAHVGLAFEGRAHSGIDDAKNLGSLTCKMVRDGALFAITKDLTPYQQLNPNCVL